MSARLEKCPIPLNERSEVIPYPESHADEISLIDLAMVLYRRRRLIFAVAALTVLAGLAFALIKPADYRYSTPLTLAATLEATKDGSNSIRLVESPQDVATRLNEAILPVARRTVAEHDRIDVERLPFAEVKAAKDQEQLLLTSTASEADFNLVQLVHQEALKSLQRSQDLKLFIVREQYLARLRRAELKLAELTDSAVFAAHQTEKQRAIEAKQLAIQGLTDSRRVDEKELEGRMLDATHRQASLVDQERLVRERLAKQKEAEALLRTEIGEIRDSLAAVESRQKQAEQQSSDGVNALGVMLVRSQLLQYWQRQSNLEERLTITLPAETKSLEKELADLARTRASVQATVVELESRLSKLRADYERKAQSMGSELGQKKKDYEKFLTDHERARLLQEQQVAELQAIVNQIRPTGAMEVAVRSDKPVGPRKLVVLIISVVLGVMLAVFAAFIAEFLGKVKAGIAQQNS